MDKIKLIIATLLIITLLPTSAFAQGDLGNPGTNTGTDGGTTVTINNPLGNDAPSDPQVLILNIITYALGFVGIVAVTVLIYGGFLYITSTGSQDRINSAKSVITYAIVGIFVIGLSILLVNAIISVLNDAAGASNQQIESGQAQS